MPKNRRLHKRVPPGCPDVQPLIQIAMQQLVCDRAEPFQGLVWCGKPERDSDMGRAAAPASVIRTWFRKSSRPQPVSATTAARKPSRDAVSNTAANPSGK